MGIYENFVLPKLVDCLCGMGPVMRQREKVVPLAKGRVLEIGVGSGLNFPFYDAEKVDLVWGLEPCGKMRKLAEKNAENVQFDVKFIDQECSDIPLEAASVDSVLVTYTLCTIPDAVKALEEVYTLLKPGGELLFCEHGLAPEKHIRIWQNLVNPVWKQLGGGCNLNRHIPDFIEKGGFTITSMETRYITSMKLASYNYWGVAVKN